MCLDITKQYFVFLLALKQAKPRQLDWFEIAKKMETLSEENFGSIRFSSFPAPLLSLIKDAKEAGEIRGVDGRYEIVEQGEINLQFIESNFINPSKKREAFALVPA